MLLFVNIIIITFFPKVDLSEKKVLIESIDFHVIKCI